MFPTWARPALVRVGILAGAIAAVLIGIKVVSSTMGQAREVSPRSQSDVDSEKPPVIAAVNPAPAPKQEAKLPQPETPAKQEPKATPVTQEPKTAPKAGPDVGLKKDEPKTAQEPTPTEPKLISLTQAIVLAERAGKGEAVLAEKVGAGDKAAFNVDVLAGNGAKSRFNVNATGKVIVEVAIPARKGPGNQGKDRKKGGGERPAEKKTGEREREDR
jgi:hypothetical protein